MESIYFMKSENGKHEKCWIDQLRPIHHLQTTYYLPNLDGLSEWHHSYKCSYIWGQFARPQLNRKSLTRTLGLREKFENEAKSNDLKYTSMAVLIKESMCLDEENGGKEKTGRERKVVHVYLTTNPNDRRHLASWAQVTNEGATHDPHHSPLLMEIDTSQFVNYNY